MKVRGEKSKSTAKRMQNTDERRDAGVKDGGDRRPTAEDDGGRRKATAMSKQEMVHMVSIMEKKDYDCKSGEYSRPNTRKNHILDIVIHGLERKFGVSRSKDQLRKRWSDLKLRERDQLETIRRIIKKKDKRKKLLQTHRNHRRCASSSASSSMRKPQIPVPGASEKDDDVETDHNESDEHGHKSQEIESTGIERQEIESNEPDIEPQSSDTSDVKEIHEETVCDTAPSSPCILVSSTEESMAAQNVLYLCIAEQPDLETPTEISNTEINQGPDPNNPNVVEDIQKCKILLATIKQSVKVIETTLESICQKVCNTGE
eukprot:XP_012809378.1 PREDICTED: uncharacterized protein LOC105945562 [Xenopus tropicalis]